MLQHVQTSGAYLMEQLEKLQTSAIREVRGQGLMIGIQLDQPVKEIINQAAQMGLLVLSAGPDVLRLLPPYVITHAQIDQAVEILAGLLP